MQAKGTVSGPLGDKIAGRFSAQDTQRDGLLTNVKTGEKLNELDNYAVRGQLLVVPNDRLKIRMIYDVTDLDSACCTQTYLRVGTSLRSASRQYPALAAGLGYAPPSTNVYDRLSDIDAPLHVNTQDGGFSVLAEWDLKATTLTSVSAWRYWDWDVANDRDYTGIPIQLVQRIPSRQDQYSQELRLNSKGTGPFNYVAGALLVLAGDLGHSDQHLRARGRVLAAEPGELHGADPEQPARRLQPDRQLGLQDGQLRAVRRGQLRVHGQVDGHAGASLHAREQGRRLRDAGFRRSRSHGTTARDRRRAALRAKLSIFRPQSYTAHDDGGSWSGRANVAYQFTDDLMGYVSYARGYKSGGLNMSGLPLDAQNQPALATAVIKDEQNSTYELGFKSTLRDGKATLNLAAYHTVVEDYQSNVVSSLETAAIRSYPANIPEVRVQGLEADFTTLVTEGFTVRFSLAYADGENTDYPAGPCPLEVQTAATVACNLTGVPLPGLSKWSGSLGLDYRKADGTRRLHDPRRHELPRRL